MALRSAFLLAAALLSAAPLVADPPVDRPGSRKVRAEGRPLTATDLSGEWRMFLPAGWERTVELERLGENRYYFRPPYVMKGTYDVRGRELAFVSEDRLEGDAELAPEEDASGDDGDSGEFVWKIRSAYLMTLTGGAGAYRDAILFRSNGRELKPRKAPGGDEAPPQERSLDLNVRPR